LPHQLQVSPRLLVKWRLARRQVVQYLVRHVVISRPPSMSHTLGTTTDIQVRCERAERAKIKGLDGVFGKP
jgi:hypothetical protein